MYAMDMRQYDPAIARWVVQDPVVHHNFSPYNAFDNNPVYWADPSGADSQRDYQGLNRFDEWGTYIPAFERVDDGYAEYYRNNHNAKGKIVSQTDGGMWLRFFTGFKDQDYSHVENKFNLDEIELIKEYEYHYVAKSFLNTNNFSDFLGNTNTKIGFAGIATGLLENSIANSRWWLDSKGKYNSAKILARGKDGKYLNGFRGIAGKQIGYNNALKHASKAKIAGATFGVASAGISIYRATEYYVNDGKGSEVAIKASLDATMSLVGAFGGPVGFTISAAYFLIDYATDGLRGYGKID